MIPKTPNGRYNKDSRDGDIFMVTISVPFPEDLREKAEAVARERGLTLDEFVRRCVSMTVGQGRAADPLFADKEVFAGDAPSDLAKNHDRYLYEADT